MPDAWSRLPIFVLSEGGQNRDRLAALDVSADGDLTKPFGIAESHARLIGVSDAPARRQTGGQRSAMWRATWHATSSPRLGRRST